MDGAVFPDRGTDRHMHRKKEHSCNGNLGAKMVSLF